MDQLVGQLPTWALLVVAVVWVAFKATQEWNERQEEKRRQEAREQYRAAKSDGKSSVPPTDSRPFDRQEVTGKHHMREVFEEEREREQRVRILALAEENAAMMERLVAAEGTQTQLLTRVVDMLERQERLQERQGRTLEQLSDTQRAIVRYLRRLDSDRPPPGETLKELAAVPQSKGT